MIDSTAARRTFAEGVALLAWAALALQFWLTVNIVLAQGRGFVIALVVFFGFFTALTNLLAALVTTECAAGPAYDAFSHRAVRSS